LLAQHAAQQPAVKFWPPLQVGKPQGEAQPPDWIEHVKSPACSDISNRLSKPVLQGFCDMILLDVAAFFQIGDGSGNP